MLQPALTCVGYLLCQMKPLLTDKNNHRPLMQRCADCTGPGATGEPACIAGVAAAELLGLRRSACHTVIA